MSGLDHAVWDALPLPALVLDDAGRVSRINPAAEGFLNVSNRAAEGAGLWDLLQVAAPPDAALLRARSDGRPLFVNDVCIGAGRAAPVRCSLSVAPLEGGIGAALVVATPRDMAGQGMQDGSARMATRSAIGMTEMLAHEIKNPLAGITGAAQLLSMTLGAADRELTDLIVGESRRIAALLDQVERFGNPAAPDLRAVNIHDVLTRARRSAQLGFAADMTMIEEYDPSLPDALADAGMLQQVVDNLIKNAVEAAGGRAGTIRLRSRFEQGAPVRGDAGKRLPLVIEVVDDGPGVPEALRDALFEPFVSGREDGTGLGLAIAARIIEGHGGWIAVASAPGHTVFRVSLPMASAAGRR
ncbi:two-component system sensor histidine kinase NtrB [Roseovarius dicentrarchi]|uniref:two-component system sensor histidine kinase NtrB n=1 Tax=Roseovarius dicentrarchi TaxID=2250573 RepID=UPI000DEAA483|nr:ATP-binding protein [Roseovarius dicentrarchi]